MIHPSAVLVLAILQVSLVLTLKGCVGNYSNNNQVAFLLDVNGYVYSSSNFGVKWDRVSAITYPIEQIIASRVAGDPLVFFNGQMTGATASPRSFVWDGTTYSQVTTPLYFSTLVPHPVQRTWWLASGILASGTSAKYGIYYSQDGGLNWKVVTSTATGLTITWGNAGTGQIPETRFYYLGAGFCFTDDFGQSSQCPLNSASTFDFGSNFLTVGAPNDDGSGVDQLILYSARDWGYGNGIEVSTLNNTYFPDRTRLPTPPNYQILNEATGIWLGVAYSSVGNGHYGAIYQSDRYGVEFTRHDAKVSTLFESDSLTFDYVSLPGYDGATILTNTVVNWQQTQNDKSTDKLQTWVTYDAGGTWQTLPGPNCLPSQPTCRLNLHSRTSTFDHIKSTANAIGIVIGTGSEGDFLSQTSVNTYISTDTGRTWNQVPNLPSAPYVSQISAGGGIILFVPKIGTQLWYSLDAGATTAPLNFAPQNVQVDKVHTDPEHVGQTFFIVGRVADTQAPFTRAVTFSLPACQAGTPNVENWIPQECVLGQTIQYLRKSPSAICAYTSLYNAQTVNTCDCTREDFECAFGYALNPNTQACDEVNGAVIPKGQPPLCPAGKTYEVSVRFSNIQVPSGYRFIPGDACTGGVASTYAPQVKDCVVPDPPDQGMSTVLVFFLAFGVVVIVLLLVFIVSLRFEAVRERLPPALIDRLPPWLVGGYVPQPIGNEEDDELGTAISPDLIVQDQEDEEPDELNFDGIDRAVKQRERKVDDDDFNPRMGD